MSTVQNDDVWHIAQEIVAREGGYVNDPDDLGGATNFGVTIHTMRRLGLDLTGDGRVTASDVKALTRKQALDIFVAHYFEKPGIARLPVALQASVFDMYVNAGSNAVKILQRLVSKMRPGCILPMPMRLSGAITISASPTNAPPRANTRARGQGAKAAGSNAQKSFYPPVTT
jgi:lysozyme family protein